MAVHTNDPSTEHLCAEFRARVKVMGYTPWFLRFIDYIALAKIHRQFAKRGVYFHYPYPLILRPFVLWYILRGRK